MKFDMKKNFISFKGPSLVAQLVKNLPAMWETGVRLLDQEDPLEKEMATRSSILAWRISWTEEPGRLQFMGSFTFFFIFGNRIFVYQYIVGNLTV